MPGLIGLSPLLADHTFPRSDEELRTVAEALGNLSAQVQSRTVRLLSTAFFVDLLADYKWDGKSGIKEEIYKHLRLWFLNGHAITLIPDLNGQPYALHPVPEGCTDKGVSDLWADEFGQLLVYHDRFAQAGEYLIGVACEKAFSGGTVGLYAAHTCARHFPLVGPQTCDCRHAASLIADLYAYEIPPEVAAADVSFENAKNHCSVLGGSVRKPKRGSHHKVKFKNAARPWVLDPNNDPLPERFLKQLVAMTGRPLDVIKYVLLYGKFPTLRPKMPCSVS